MEKKVLEVPEDNLIHKKEAVTRSANLLNLRATDGTEFHSFPRCNQQTDERTPNWDPFLLAPAGFHGEPPRAITVPEGIGDRLRAAAFAELQAREAFLWASRTFNDASPSLRNAWIGLAHAEDRHLSWLLRRMNEQGVGIQERKVSDHLWHSLRVCTHARDFTLYMASAEERGRKAGERFCQAMATIDPISARLFGEIAREEKEHIALAYKYFPLEAENFLLGRN